MAVSNIKTITRKTDLIPSIQAMEQEYKKGNLDAFWKILENEILMHKVKFPVLEYVANTMYDFIPLKDQQQVMDKIIDTTYMASFPLVGKLLQLRLTHNLEEQFILATKYMVQGDEWYACDIIAERVYGHGALIRFEKAYSLLLTYSQHNEQWVRRAVGVAVHYAVKKGLDKTATEKLFRITMDAGGTKNTHVKRGMGWGAKTVARFHPDIVSKYENKITDNPNIGQWYKTKVNIGLGRAAMVKRTKA